MFQSPDGTRSVKTFKKESYSYKTSKDNISPERVRMQDNINQLDSLLDDLQQTKQTSSMFFWKLYVTIRNSHNKKF